MFLFLSYTQHPPLTTRHILHVSPELNTQHNLNQQAHNTTNNTEWNQPLTPSYLLQCWTPHAAVHNLHSWRGTYRCPKHVQLFMIINHNCCIQLVPLVMSIYDARSHIHHTCKFCSTAPFYTCHCCSLNMSLCHYVTTCHYVTHNATINCVAVLTAIWIRLNTEWCRDGSVGIVTTVRPWTVRGKIANKGKRVFSSPNPKSVTQSHPACCSLGTGWNGSGVNLTVVARLRMSGVIPLLHPCTFVVLTGTSSTFTFTFTFTFDTPAYCTESDVTSIWRLYPNNCTAIWRLYPNNWTAIRCLYPNNWTAIWRLYPNNCTAIWCLYPNNWTAIWCLYPNNWTVIWCLYPNNWTAIWCLYPNSWTAIWCLYPNNWTAIWRLYPNNWTAVWREIDCSFEAKVCGLPAWHTCRPWPHFCTHTVPAVRCNMLPSICCCCRPSVPTTQSTPLSISLSLRTWPIDRAGTKLCQ